MTNTLKAMLSFLFVLVIASLAMNIMLIWQLLTIQRQTTNIAQVTQQSVTQAITDLDEFQQSTIRLTVPIANSIPVRMNIPINRTINVPINTVIPIKQTIKAQVPIDINGIKIPLNVDVPIDMKVPVNLNQEVLIDFTVPVSTSVPLNMEIPIALEVSKTDLAKYIDRLKNALITVNTSITTMGQ